MFAVPEVGGRKQVRTRIVVVFPAPFGPRKPTICPFSTSKEMLSTATVRAYRFVRPSTLIILLSPSSDRRIDVTFGRRRHIPNGYAGTILPMKFNSTDAGQVLSILEDRGLPASAPGARPG